MDKEILVMAKQKINKYRNVKVVVDGKTFGSKAEAKRYGELKLLKYAGEIPWFICQYKIPITVNDVFVCYYIADFMYPTKDYLGSFKEPVQKFIPFPISSNAFNEIFFKGLAVEDVKGVKTALYILKKKLVKAIYGIDIIEIDAKKKRTSKRSAPHKKIKYMN